MPGEMHIRGAVRREEGGYRRHGEKQPEEHRQREGDFRYVYIDLIDGFSASNFRQEILLCKDFDMISNLSVIN